MTALPRSNKFLQKQLFYCFILNNAFSNKTKFVYKHLKKKNNIENKLQIGNDTESCL